MQERWFAAQVALAEELGKPLFLHNRDAGQRFAEILRCGCVVSIGPQVAAQCPLPWPSTPLPLALTDRDTLPSLLARRQHRRSVPGVAHCFVGSAQELADFLSAGLHIGITGWLTDERPGRGGAELAALLPSIPADRLMIETDCPYITPRSITPAKARPQRNEPALLPHVLAAVAAARGEDPGTTAASTTATARAFFGLPAE